jgi:hypothetical protein
VSAEGLPQGRRTQQTADVIGTERWTALTRGHVTSL